MTVSFPEFHNGTQDKTMILHHTFQSESMPMKPCLHPFYCLLICLTMIPCVFRIDAEDWPSYRHDTYRSGVTSEDLRAERLQKVWTWQSPHPADPAWPGPAKWDAYAGIKGLKSMRNYDPAFHLVAVDDCVYFGSSADDAMRALDAKTGEQRWIFHADAPIRIAPTIVEGRLYMGSDDGVARCLDAKTGEVIWSYRPKEVERWILNNGHWIPFWPIRTGVTVMGDTAYFAASLLPWKESYLCAVDALTGLPEGPGRFVKRIEDATFEGALLASSDHLVAPQGRVSPLIYRRSDGELLGGLKGGGGCFVMLTPDEEILHGPGNKTGWVTGSQMNNQTTYATFKDASAMVVHGKTTFMITETGVSALDRQERQEQWSQAYDKAFTLIKGGEEIYVGGEDRCVALDATTGDRVWEGQVQGRAHGLVLANGALYATTDEGGIHCFRPVAQEDHASESPSVEVLEEEREPTQPIEVFESDQLVSRWVFHQEVMDGKQVRNLASGRPIHLVGSSQLARLEGLEVLRLDGKTSGLIRGDLSHADMPVETFSVEAWVRVDEPLSWGGIIGAIQDNGSYEKGWLLGFQDQRFSFALNGQGGPDRLQYMAADQNFDLKRWYYLSASYDGKRMRLYVDGEPVAESTQQSGPIQYPPSAFYEVGAYHDQDEHYQTKGMLHEVRLYHRVLSAEEMAQHAIHRRFPLPEPPEPVLELAEGPVLTFTSSTSARVDFETLTDLPTRVSLELDGERIGSWVSHGSSREHHMSLEALRHRRVYTYRIEQSDGQGGWLRSEPFECDTLFNFTVAALAPWPDKAQAAQARRESRMVLEASGVERGICLVLGSGQPAFWHTLAEESHLRVMAGVTSGSGSLADIRQSLTEAGSYGARVHAQSIDLKSAPPLIDFFANLLVWKDWHSTCPPETAAQLVIQWLRPDGGVALLASPLDPRLETPLIQGLQSTGCSVEAIEGFFKITRGPLEGAGEWSHQYGNAANGAYAGESLGGASSTEDLEVQWLGRPGPRAQPDRNGRKPSPLSTGGRLFVQGLNRMIALDAYNGTILWSKELPRLQRFNMPRDSSNWAADESFVFTAMEGACWKWHADSGELAARWSVPEAAVGSHAMDWSYVSPYRDKLIGSAVFKDSAYSNFWGGGNAGWYDAKSGEVTFKVSSESLYAVNAETGLMEWHYQGGLIVNSTLTWAEDRIWFVEARDPSLKEKDQRQLEGEALWRDLSMVCLSLENGQPLWEQPLQVDQGEVALYMAQSENKVVLVASGGGAYHTYAYRADTGQLTWKRDVKWPQDHHGGHMARPAIVKDVVYVRPAALSLSKGDLLNISMPGGGCGTYAASEQALFFRSGNVTVWDQKEGETTSWKRLRPDCWLSTIPAAGMLLSPEGGGGCSCGSWMETSIVFAPL